MQIRKLLVIGLLLAGFAGQLVAAPKPNILLIFSDDHAKKALSCYGNTVIQTPSLDRLASEGMRFENALTPNSFCTPARAAALTGKYSHKNGVTHLNQSFDGSQQTFPKLLQAAGYETSLFGKWHLLSQPTGFDFYCVQKMQGMPFNPIVFEPQHEWIPWSPEDQKSFLQGGRKLKGYNNDAITTEALVWLKKQRDPDKPFCMLLHPKPPHAPYNPPPPGYEDFLKEVEIPEPATLLDDYEGRTPEAIADKMTSNRLVLAPTFQELRRKLEEEDPEITRDELTRAIYQEYIKGYYRLVKSVDDNVGRVLDYLEESGLDKNTLVIYTSDQGFSLGEHGFYNKQWMYENPLHQPLLVRFPGLIEPGTVHHSMVNHVDLAPTLLDFAGLPIPGDIQGHSLKPILEGKAEKVRDASYYHFYDHGKRLPEMIGVRTETHKLIHYPGMKGAYQWELFDLTKDPEEMNNLYSNPEHEETRERLEENLRALIEELEDPVEAPNLGRAQSSESPTESAKSRLVRHLEAGEKQTVVTYGTSLTKVGAWVDQLRSVLEQQYPGQVNLINSGSGGSNSDWGRENFEERVIRKNPDTVLIEFAVNDAVASRQTSVAHARENLEDMIDRLQKAHPACEIILMVMNPPVAHTKVQRPDLAAYNQMYRDVAKERGFQLIDHYPAWEKILNEDPGRFLQYVPDGIHPVRLGALRVITPTMMKELGVTGGDPDLNQETPCWDYLFRMMDNEVNQNREVSREEYQSFWSSHFTKQDADENGILKPSEYEPPSIFNHVDANQDGQVDPDEYQAAYASHFTSRDKNNDEVLVEGEIWAEKNEAPLAGKIKNILFIMSDDLKASALAAYGNDVCKTPNLDRLAASGMVFDRAYCQGLACAPSRPSMMRSIYPESKATALTLGEHLQKHGMHTARVGKIFHMGVPNSPRNGDSGLDVPECWTEFHNTKSAETFTPGLYRLMNRGIATRVMEGRQGAGTRERMWTSVEADQEDGSDQADYMVATKAVELLQQRQAEGKPFFLGVGFFRPHYPMVAPKKFFDRYPQETMKIPPQIEGDLDDIPRAGHTSMGDGLNDTEEGRRRMWQAYYASVTFMDEQVGRVVDELDRLGLRDSTAIIFTTDHGYHLGEHGFWQKANLHEEVVRIPFIVCAPGLKPGRTSSLVELVDFYPTCTDLLGLPTPKGLHGLSLVPILRNPEATVRDTALSINIRGPGGAIRAATWHYMNYGGEGEGEELYDMVKDPHQYTNVVDDPAYADMLKEARAKFEQRMATAK